MRIFYCEVFIAYYFEVFSQHFNHSIMAAVIVIVNLEIMKISS